MKVACPTCNANLNIDDAKIPAGGARIKCPTCKNIFPVKPAAQAAPAGVPLPGAASARPAAAPRAAAVPLPGLTAAAPEPTSWEDEPTRAVPLPGAMGVPPPGEEMPTRAVPIPKSLLGASVPPPIPLPGAQTGYDEGPTRAVPIPRNLMGAPPAIPLPGLTAAKPQQTHWEDEPTRAVAAAPVSPGIPLPGARAAHTDIPFDDVPSPDATHVGPAPSADEFGVDFDAPPPPADPAGDLPFDSLGGDDPFGAQATDGQGAPAMGSDFGEAPIDTGFDTAAPTGEFGAMADATDFEVSSPSGFGEAPAIPLPGQAQEPAFEETDASFDEAPAISLPGAAVAPPARASSGAGPSISLPGAAAAPPARASSGAGPSISLPGAAVAPPVRASAGPSISLPGAAAAPPARASAGPSISLPGAAAAAPPARASSGPSISLPGAAAAPPARASAGPSISLPGAAAPSRSPARELVELPGDADFGEAPAADPFGFAGPDQPPQPAAGGFGFGEAPPEADPSFGAQGDVDFGAPPPPPAAPAFNSDGNFDFGAPPPAPAAPAFSPDGNFDFGAPPPAPGAPAFSPDGNFDFGAPPPAPGAPVSSASSAFLFGEAAPPTAAPAGGGLAFDFGAPPPAPPAAAGGAFDFGAPQPAAPAPMASFGEVPMGGDSLEFDPTAPPPGGGHGGDDFEADLSSPIPPPSAASGPADGLEMLNFIDKAAQDAGPPSAKAAPGRRFHVKRRSGKVFGPFEEAVIVKMLEDAQLLGNEEVSLDSENWQPIGTEGAFQAVIARLMEMPARAGTQLGTPVMEEPQKGPSMERLKQVYEGRMAAVAVVKSADPFNWRKRLPLIIAASLLATVIGVGVFLGAATPYGYFALKVLFPAKVKAGTREFEYLTAARRGFLTDTFKSYRAAKDQASQALQVKEYPEARAIWCQSVYYLKRKYGLADPAELAKATDELPNIMLLGEKHPEVLKALAGAALTDKRTDDALGYLGDALARQENQNDLELLFLRAEAQLQKKQVTPAKSDFEQVLKKDAKSARALHALGLLRKSLNELDPAREAFTKALEVSAEHTVSAVELAELDILVVHDREGGRANVERALAAESKANLAPSELGRALALKAEILVQEGKVTEAVALFEEALKIDGGQPFTKTRLANAYMQGHQPEKAFPLYRDTYAVSQENLDFVQGYLSTLLTLGKMDDAVKVVQSANTRFPGNAVLAYLSGRVSDALDKTKEAEDAYKRAIAAQPQNAEAYLYLARLHMRFRRYAEAGPILAQGLEKDAQSAGLHVGMGELSLQEGDQAKAQGEFTRATELDPNNAEAHLGLSKVALASGQAELANQEADKAVALNPRVPGGKLQKGSALWKLGQLDEAIATLSKAREEDPKNVQLTVTLGAVKFEKGDLEGALGHLSSALGVENGNAEANYYLARVKNVRAEHTQAIEALKRALDYNGRSPLYRYWMGRILLDARKPAEAIEEWKQALDIDPKYLDALEAMGKVHFERATPADLKKAVELFERALAVDPKRTSVLVEIGETQIKQENWDAAISSFMRALEADPEGKEVGSIYFRLGQCWQEKRKASKAIEWYRKALESDPRNGDAWLNLGYLYKDAHKRTEAAEAFTHFLEVRPNAENKKEIEDEIYFIKQEK